MVGEPRRLLRRPGSLSLVVSAPTTTTYQRAVNLSRMELENAGNPSYSVVVTAGEQMEIVSMVFSTLKPATEHATRLQKLADPEEKIFIVGRHVAGQRVTFQVMDPHSRKLHTQLEVIEPTFAEEDKMM